jgi:hypothetical protein
VLALFLMGLWWFWHGSERHVGGRKDAASWKALAGALDRVEKAMKKQEEEEEENGEGDEEDGDEVWPYLFFFLEGLFAHTCVRLLGFVATAMREATGVEIAEPFKRSFHCMRHQGSGWEY